VVALSEENICQALYFENSLFRTEQLLFLHKKSYIDFK